MNTTTAISSAPKISILLADDHQMLLDLWFFILSRDGRFHVTAKVSNGKTAAAIATAHHPDIAILDINMGEPDGFETIKLIRRFSPATRIIMMSMYVLPAYAKKAKQFGAMGYVTKSSPAEELIEAIIEVYNKRTYFCREIEANISAEKESVSGEGKASLLTNREIEIVRLIEKGFTSKQIADQLFLSVKTVNIHRYRIFRKLKVKNVTSLISATQALGL